MKINPMLKKEIMVSVRGIRLTVIMLIFNIVLALIGLVVFYSILENAKWSGSIDYSATISLYCMLVVFQVILLIFIVPALTAGSISGERERQTLDILLSSSLSPGKIIFGKLSSSLLSVLLLIFSSLPVMSLVFIFGGVEIADVVVNILFLMYIAFLAGSIGISCSARFRKTGTATAMSYGVLLLIGLGTILATVLLMIMYEWTNTGEWARLLAALVLLVNPGTTLMEIIGNQITGEYFMQELFYSSSGLLYFVTSNWIPASIITQILMVTLILRSAVRRVNPLSKGKPFKQGKPRQ